MTTKRLYRDIATGELIDADSVYELVPISVPEPDEPRRAYTHPVPPPPEGARTIRNRQDDTLRYVFGESWERPEPNTTSMTMVLAILLGALATGALIGCAVWAGFTGQWRI